jgi:RecA/RadA recombinase
MSILENLKKQLEGYIPDEVETTIPDWIDTGHIGLNCLISADPYKGIPVGKIIQFAGEQSTGKTYIAHNIIKNAQAKGYDVIIFDSEYAQDKEDLERKGIDLKKILIIPEGSIEKFRTKLVNLLDSLKPSDKVMIVVDSLGNFYTEKEYKDAQTGSDKADMTRAKLLKSIFRLASVKIGKLGIPMILINHVYADQSSFIKRNIVSGGGGSLYSSSAIIELTKAQDKDSKGKNVGVIITGKSIKSRLAKEKQKVKIAVHFSKGISRYSGLLEFAIEGGFIKDLGRKRYEYNGEKITIKDMKKEFWEELLKNGFADYLRDEFSYKNELLDDIIEEDESEPELLQEDVKNE